MVPDKPLSQMKRPPATGSAYKRKPATESSSFAFTFIINFSITWAHILVVSRL